MIDPEKLERQRLSLVRPSETKCSACGRRTRDATGKCAPCRRSLPDLRRLSTEQVAGFIDACRAELKRRRDEIEKAMEGA